MAGKSFTVSIVVGLKDQASKGLKSITRGIKSELRGAVKSAKPDLRSLGAGMVSLGNKFWEFGRDAVGFVISQLKKLVRVAKWAGLAVATGFILATTQAAGFEDVMMDVEIQSGATAEAMADIKASAFERDFSRLGKTATNVGESYKRLAAEGYKVIQMRQMLKPILETSVALGVEEAATTKLMLNLMEQFNLEAEDMGHIGDVLASALAETSFQGSELAETMKMAGVAGRMMGWDLEGTIAVTDRIIKVTGEAGLAGRYYRQLMFSMSAPTKRMADEYARVGISLEDIAAAGKDPVRLARLLTVAHGRGINFARAYGSIAAVAAAALVGEADAIEEVRAALGKSGAAHDAAIKKSSTLGGIVRGLVAGFKNLGVTIGTGFIPAAKLAAATVREFTEGLIESGKAKEFGAMLGKAALAATTFVIAFAKGDVLKKWFGFFKAGFGEIWKLLSGADNRFAQWAGTLGQEIERGITAGIVAVGPIVARVIDDVFGEGTWGRVRELLGKVGEVGKEVFGALVAMLPSVKAAIVEIVPPLTGLVKWLLNLVAEYPKVAAGIIVFSMMASVLAPIVNLVRGLVGGIASLVGWVSGLGVTWSAIGAGLLAAGPWIILGLAVAGLAVEIWYLVKAYKAAAAAGQEMLDSHKQQQAAEVAAVKAGYGDPGKLARQQAAVAAAKPTFGERAWGGIMGGGVTGYSLARSRVAAGQESVAYRPAAQGPGVARPTRQTTVNINGDVYGVDDLDRRIHRGVRTAASGAY